MKNKNILFITHTYTTFQKTQIESVSKYFNKVFVLVRYKPIAEISRILPIRSLRYHTKQAAINLKNKPENVTIYPIPILYFPWKRSYLKLGDRLLRKSRRIIKEKGLEFDIIHAHYTWTSGYIATKLKEEYDKPVIITNHSTHQLTKYISRNSIWKQKISQTIRDADYIFVVNSFMKQRILEIHSQARVDITPVGYDQDIFFTIRKNEARKALSLPLGDPIIINISRLDKNKNLPLFIKGISELRKRYQNLLGIIIGDGPDYNKLQMLITNLKVGNNIKLLGMIPHKDINLWINASDFVALTSFSEGSPTVMYESLACGKPFLGSAVGGIPEIINQEYFGCTFDPYNLKDFVNKMDYMLGKDWEYQKIQSYGANFSQGNISKDIKIIYEKLLFNYNK